MCAHTEDAQSDLNQFLLTFSRQHGRRVTIADTTKYSLSAAIKPIISGSSRVSRNFRRWSCICCTCKLSIFLLPYFKIITIRPNANKNYNLYKIIYL